MQLSNSRSVCSLGRFPKVLADVHKSEEPAIARRMLEKVLHKTIAVPLVLCRRFGSGRHGHLSICRSTSWSRRSNPFFWYQKEHVTRLVLFVNGHSRREGELGNWHKVAWKDDASLTFFFFDGPLLVIAISMLFSLSTYCTSRTAMRCSRCHAGMTVVMGGALQRIY